MSHAPRRDGRRGGPGARVHTALPVHLERAWQPELARCGLVWAFTAALMRSLARRVPEHRNGVRSGAICQLSGLGRSGPFAAGRLHRAQGFGYRFAGSLTFACAETEPGPFVTSSVNLRPSGSGGALAVGGPVRWCRVVERLVDGPTRLESAPHHRPACRRMCGQPDPWFRAHGCPRGHFRSVRRFSRLRVAGLLRVDAVAGAF